MRKIKATYAVLLILVFAAHPASAQLSDATGLLNRLFVHSDGVEYEVIVVANFQAHGAEFDKERNTLSILIAGAPEDSIAEITIPNDLLGSDMVFLLDGRQVDDKTRAGNSVSFTVLNFTGAGDQELIIAGVMTDLTKVQDVAPGEQGSAGANASDADPAGDANGECLIATAAFGSEMSGQVQMLREARADLLTTESGAALVGAFSAAYYTFSPGIADYQRENQTFGDAVRAFVTPMILILSMLDASGADSEAGAALFVATAALFVAAAYLLPVIAAGVLAGRLYRHARRNSPKIALNGDLAASRA